MTDSMEKYLQQNIAVILALEQEIVMINIILHGRVVSTGHTVQLRPLHLPPRQHLPSY